MVKIQGMDLNLRDSWNRAKEDIYSLMRDRDEHKKWLTIFENNLFNLENHSGSVKKELLQLEKIVKLMREEYRAQTSIVNEHSRIIKLFALELKLHNELLKQIKLGQKNLSKKVVASDKLISKHNVKKPAVRSRKYGALYKYSLLDIKGINTKIADVLKKNNVKTAIDLLNEGATDEGRSAISKRTKFKKTQILEWVNRADLMRIGGIGKKYSDLLEEAGVDTVPELAQRNSENLNSKLSEINSKKKLVKVNASETRVKKWISQAKRLPKLIRY